MINPLLRRLRVRDDGTGNSRPNDGTLPEFDAEDAVVLIGDPGMGKTTLFREVAKEAYTTVRQFLANPHGFTNDIIYLDALDEHRAIEGGQDACSGLAKALCALGKPKFRLSCRAADWFGSRDQEVISVASKSGRIVVLELLPLSHDEITNVVQGIVADPTVFLEEAETAGLDNLLRNPQTLNLVARAWGTDPRPTNKDETYEKGIQELLREVNPAHSPRGASRVSINDLRKAAAAVASILLLSGSVGVSRTDAADGEGYVRFSDIPHGIRNDADSVLRRRLFVSSEADRFEPVHRTIVEYLAAEDLSRRILNGLPIERVMALICGIDGKPVSPLRGVFAWLMCRIGVLAENYVDRDPYGVSTYGDASALSPASQRAIWAALRKLKDPWFLASEDGRGSFRELANPNTAMMINELLQDHASGIHLKVAGLESIANSTTITGMEKVLRAMVVQPNDNTWLRSTALKAFIKSVRGDWAALDSLEQELARATSDPAAPYVRITLLSHTRSRGRLAARLISILRQATDARGETRVSGLLYSLTDLPSNSDLDEILDGASSVLMQKAQDRIELQTIFDQWLSRRLSHPTSITAAQLVRWMRSIHLHRYYPRNDYLEVLRSRFENEPALLDEVFEILVSSVRDDDAAFRRFVLGELWQILPPKAWPGSSSHFFLRHAEQAVNPAHGAALFFLYLSWFPSKDVSSALAEAGFQMLARRRDIARVLKKWDRCKIEKWRTDDLRRRQRESQKASLTRTKNIAFLGSRIRSIREGSEESILVWATKAYCGLTLETSSIAPPRERLVSLTDESIANALIEGLSKYATSTRIPHFEEVLVSWQGDNVPYTHILLSLSVYMRLKTALPISADALPHCFAAVLATLNTHLEIPDFSSVLSGWITSHAKHNSEILAHVLTQLWLSGGRIGKRSLPGFYELSLDSECREFLASVSAAVLRGGINQDEDSVRRLLGVLLLYDQRGALAIGREEFARDELSPAVRTVWSTALFLIEPNLFLETWRSNLSEPQTNPWEAIKVIAGNEREGQQAVTLTPAQRTEIIRSFGRRFVMLGHPTGAWSGSENPWDASDFVTTQIKLLAADNMAGTSSLLDELENDPSLATYRDVIRHQRTQHERSRRDSDFSFAAPLDIERAIANGPPAKPLDLLAYIVDHLVILARELRQTQRERYRAYWNEDGREFINPKREEICSGLLADDLQKRVQPHDLIVTVEHHMVADKECDLVVLQGVRRLLPVEVKHHYHPKLWEAWRTQLDHLYTCDANAGGLGIYVVLWSGEGKGRKMPKLPRCLKGQRPKSAEELQTALEGIIPEGDRYRLRVVIVDISELRT